MKIKDYKGYLDYYRIHYNIYGGILDDEGSLSINEILRIKNNNGNKRL